MNTDAATEQNSNDSGLLTTKDAITAGVSKRRVSRRKQARFDIVDYPIDSSSDRSKVLAKLSKEQELELAQLIMTCYKQWKQQ